ncbi:hypothetical protein AB0G73_10745 [Streptomyces sp. NPDC020719]|uniref:hypothetical protein n=1 Tax=Streptomyces sp. NPDC020719 TaxID=3154896 RepID=UPI003407DD06
MDSQTFTRNCTRLVSTYGEEIDRALRIQAEECSNAAIAMTNRHKELSERQGGILPGMVQRIDELKSDAHELRSARQWLADARELGADPDRAVWFVAVYAQPVGAALVRQRASDQVTRDRLAEELEDAADGPARTYIAKAADLAAHQIEALSDARDWLKRLDETEVERRSEQQ